MKTIPLQIRIPADDLEWLRAHATAQDRSIAQEIRKMIRDKRKRNV
jgi:hypothetical protein